MPDLAATNNAITANGTYTQQITPGRYYALGAGGTFGSGSLAVSWTDVSGNSATLPSSPLTAAGGFVFVAPANALTLVLSGATDPNIKVSIATVAG
jgi:hypothetical protein